MIVYKPIYSVNLRIKPREIWLLSYICYRLIKCLLTTVGIWDVRGKSQCETQVPGLQIYQLFFFF